MRKIKVTCPCCNEEIILEINVLKVDSDNKKKSKKLIKVNDKQIENKNIEFGCLKEVK